MLTRAGRYGPKVISRYLQAECRCKININICWRNNIVAVAALQLVILHRWRRCALISNECRDSFRFWVAARIFEQVVLLPVMEEVGHTLPFSCDRFEALSTKTWFCHSSDTLYPNNFLIITKEPLVFCLHTSSSAPRLPADSMICTVGDFKKCRE